MTEEEMDQWCDDELQILDERIRNATATDEEASRLREKIRDYVPEYIADSPCKQPENWGKNNGENNMKEG